MSPTGAEVGRGAGQGEGAAHDAPAALCCSPGSSRLHAGVAPSHSAQEQGRDPEPSLPAADIKAASVFNVGTAEHRAHSLWGLHPEGHRAPGPPAHAQRPRPALALSQPRGRCPGPSPRAAGAARPAPGASAPSLPLPHVGLDGVGRSHGRQEAHGVCQPKADVLGGPAG